MKKVFCFLFAILVSFSFYIMVEAGNERIYNDLKTNVSFAIPQGWQESPLSEQRETIDVKYVPKEDDGTTIMFGVGDMWEEMSEQDKKGYSREDLDISILKEMTEDEFLNFIGAGEIDSSIKSVYYNKKEYLEICGIKTINVLDTALNANITFLFNLENGYFYQFQFWGIGDNEQAYYQDFQTMMETVEYPTTNIEKKETVYFENGKLKIDFSNLIVRLILTIAIYSLPIIIYRYFIRKQPLENSKAMRVTIIYAIIAFFVMTLLLGGIGGAALVFWSGVNYRILIKPAKNDIEFNRTPLKRRKCEILKNDIEEKEVLEKDSTELQATEKLLESEPTIKVCEEVSKNENKPKSYKVKAVKCEKPRILFCRRCGERLLNNSEFCHKCGTRIIRE